MPAQTSNTRRCAGTSLSVDAAEAQVIGAVVTRLAALAPDSDELRVIATRWLRAQDPATMAQRDAAREAVAAAETNVEDLETARCERNEFPGPDGAKRRELLRLVIDSVTVKQFGREAGYVFNWAQ